MNLVPAIGPVPADILLVGEAPGREEAARGAPFVGESGQELTQYLSNAGINRYSQCRITNLVPFNPPKNRDPSAAEILEHKGALIDEIVNTRPKVIGAVGRLSASTLAMRNVVMEKEHGIPFMFGSIPVVPMYHPAAGLRSTWLMSRIRSDFEQLKLCLDGKLKPVEWAAPAMDIVELTPDNMITEACFFLTEMNSTGIVAIDTENPDDIPWSIQICATPGTVFFIRAADMVHPSFARQIKEAIENSLCVFHNARYDLAVLRKMDIQPTRFVDTMNMAYLLGEVQKLKYLAYRLLHVQMQDYEEVVRSSTESRAFDYLTKVLSMEWETPAPVLELKGRKLHTRNPQHIHTKVRRLMKKWSNDPMSLRDKWVDMKEKEYVEARIGEMPLGSVAKIDLQQAMNYACRDADVTMRVYRIMSQMLKDRGLETPLKIDMAALPMVVQMEENGFQLDSGHLIRYSIQLNHRMEKIKHELDCLLLEKGFLKKDEYYNPKSPKVAMEMLKHLKVRVKTTEAKYLIPHKGRHKAIALHLDFKKLAKLESTYTTSLVKQVKDGRIHTSLPMTVADTWRLASRNPNLQNIPVRGIDGKTIREAFIVPKGCKLLSVDYSQIEMRVAAHMSADERMIKIFRQGKDLHSMTSEAIFGDTTSEHRYPTKQAGFGILYKISPMGLHELLEAEGVKSWTEERCAQLILDWYKQYPGIAAMQDKFELEAFNTGRVMDLFGKPRMVPEVYSAHARVRNAGVRQACNAPIQSSAAGILKRAMAKLLPVCEMLSQAGHFKPLLQIHDELLFEVGEDILDMAVEWIVSAMEDSVNLIVPIKCDVEVGDNWGSLESYYEDG